MLNKEITNVDMGKMEIYCGNENSNPILLFQLFHQIFFKYCWGELAYVGRDFYKIVLPIKQVLPKDVILFIIPMKMKNRQESLNLRNLQIMKVIIH